jgi:hypothetical protein
MFGVTVVGALLALGLRETAPRVLAQRAAGEKLQVSTRSLSEP